MLTLDKAKELLNTTTTEEHLFLHAKNVSVAMGGLAKHFGEDPQYWSAVGYLHDYDYEQYPEEDLAGSVCWRSVGKQKKTEQRWYLKNTFDKGGFFVITPNDIATKDFKKVAVGYSPEEVDTFLDDIYEDYERLYKESLKEKTVVAPVPAAEDTDRFKHLEKSIERTLSFAESAAAETAAV